MKIDDPAFYERAFRRINQIGFALAAGGAIVCLAVWGARAAAGFVVGSLISFVNFRLWKRLVNAIGDKGEKPRTASAVLLGLRYLLLAGVIFVIIKYFGVSLPAVLTGLLISMAAVLVEAIYELTFT